MAGENLFFSIVSNSMDPVLKVGGEYEITHVDPQELRRFDIIVFHDQEILICHYLWHKNQFEHTDSFVTRSLISDIEDFPVSFDRYLGKVVDRKLEWWRKLIILLRYRFF